MSEELTKDLVLEDDMFEPLPEDEKNSEFIAMESKTFLQDAWRKFKANKAAMIGLSFMVIMLIGSIIIPMVSPYEYDAQDLSIKNLKPCWEHPLGTDKLGRDILVRIMYGGRVSLSIGVATAAINLFIGIIYGGISGYVGGKTDMIMMRIIDIIYSVPSLLYVVIILMIFGNSLGSMMFAICLTSWIGMARQVRAQVLSLKEMEFALAARVIGASDMRILLRHLVANAIGPIIVTLTMMIPSAIFTEAFLSMLGIGLDPTIPSWGKLANDVRSLAFTYPIQVVWPTMVICLTVLSLNFIGDGLADAFDINKR